LKGLFGRSIACARPQAAKVTPDKDLFMMLAFKDFAIVPHNTPSFVYIMDDSVPSVRLNCIQLYFCLA
jgi:hypothetical protein